MSNQPGSRVLAAPLLGAKSGGVGQVASLLWNVLEDEWPDDAELLTLLPSGRSQPTAADKVDFGARLAARQVTGGVRWIVFAHLGLARVERYLPAALCAPYAVFLHGVEAWKPLGQSDVRVLQRAGLRLANSQFTAGQVMAANPTIGEVSVCPLALPDGVWGVNDAGSKASGRRVLVVGRMSAGERYKGHEELITIWPEILRETPDAELVIVGDGDDRPRLEALASASAAGGRIQFVGFVSQSELQRLYASADVFAMPSRGEGFGLVYLEAMAHGLPCLGSVHDAAAEIVLDGETGLLVDSRDARALHHGLSALLADPALRHRFGRAGRKRLDDEFTYARFRTRAASLLKQGLEGQSEPMPEVSRA